MRLPARSTAAVGVLATAIVAGGAVAMTTRPEPRSFVAALPGEVPPFPTPTALLPSPTPLPLPTAIPTAIPTAVPTAPPTVTPTATRTPPAPPMPSPEPRASDDYARQTLRGRVDFPYRAGQTTWKATSNGVRMLVTLSTAQPRTGVPVTWTVDAASPDADCCQVYMSFGQGRASDSQLGCPEPDRYGSKRYTHTYNAAGRVYFYVYGISDRCDRTGLVTGFIDVAAGTTTKQGPSLPVVRVDSSEPAPGHEGDAHWVTLFGEARDADGFVGRLVVDWGDGTSQTFRGDTHPDGCRLGRDGWPATSTAWVPYEPPPAHEYAKAGSYTVTLTAYSTACDGTTEQRGSDSMTWVVP